VRGGTPSPANLHPHPYIEMYDKTLAGQTEAALALQEQANRFVDALDSFPSWVSSVKAALHLMGICGSTVAAPAPPLTPEETEQLRAHLRRYQLLG
jgi:4-hydroxy-tetrahydrodipicolinate synthase